MLEETQDIKKISEACWQKPKELLQKKSEILTFPDLIVPSRNKRGIHKWCISHQ